MFESNVSSRTVYRFDVDDWLVVAPDGRFDSSPRARDYVAWAHDGTITSTAAL